MKIRHLVFSLLPALAAADEATTVPDDEPLLPALPEELLFPQKGNAELPATARPVISYRAPKDEEQTWLKLLYLKETETWPDIFRRMASASHEKDMQMCHGYSLWLKGQEKELIDLRYDDDLSLSGIHADGHVYGVLFVEFNPYGVRVCPMQGYDLTGKNGGVCWQESATRLWSWAESEKFWAELPKLLKAETKTRATSVHDTAVKRDVATRGERMVVFWASAGYPAKAWWSAFARLHTAVGSARFSLVALDGLNLWNDVEVPIITPVTKATGKAKTAASTAAPATAPAATSAVPASTAPPAATAPASPAGSPAATGASAGVSTASTPSAPTPVTVAPPLHATGAHLVPTSASSTASATATATSTATATAASAATRTATTAPPAAPAASTRTTATTATPAAPAASTTATTATSAPPAAPAASTRTTATPATTPTSPTPSPASTPPAQSRVTLDSVPTNLGM